ncbi:MAG: phospholipid carrier-dependent glycosyltransferase [Deltaproteobacteria bacterium]|nr:phospholipid carrier-dependent glycosyltransferase [Deltaproteobacteria bacterium]
MRPVKRWFGAAALVWIGCVAAADVAGAQFIKNGDFSQGSAGTPTDWRIDRWDTNTGTTEFLWKAPSGSEPGQAGIRNTKPNDARYVQDLHVKEETWYHIAGKIRTENVGQGAIGAYLSLMEGFQNSQDLKGSQDWQPVELWVKTEKWQDRLTLALRVGGYSSLNTGEAWFSDITVEAVSGPPPNAKNVYQPASGGGGFAPLSLWALILLLGLMTAALWYYLRPPPGGGDRGTPAEKLGLLAFLLALLAIKMAVAPHFGFDTDLGTYKAWAIRLADRGPADFYAPNYFCDYPPGYLYVLWLLGSIYQGMHLATSGPLSTLIIKMPGLIADLLSSVLLYALLRPRAGQRTTWLVVLAYSLNPAVIFNSAIWGQTDSLFTLELFLGALLLFEGQIAFGWAVLMIAAITKPQALIFLPLFASWRGNWDRPERPIVAAATGLAVAAVLTLPFVEPLGLAAHYQKGAAYYAETSVNAFNLMAILGGFRQSDSAILLFMSYKAWATALVVLFFVYLAFLIYRRRDAEMYVYLMFLLPLGFFMLSTRMHERYLFPCLLFLTPLLPRRKHLWAFYGVLTATYYLNLWYILRALNSEVFLDKYDPFGIAVSIVNVGLFAAALAEGWRMTRLAPEPLPLPCGDGDTTLAPAAPVVARAAAPAAKPVPARAMAKAASAKARDERGPEDVPAAKPRGWVSLPQWEIEAGASCYRITRRDLALALLLVVVAGGLRFWKLEQPNELVFDEVYFVEQGKNYLRGKEFMDPHPPFAKLAIGASVALFGGEANGYRIFNAVCGTLLVGVAYLTGRKLLGDGLAAFATAAAVAFDGLFIVDSRIAVIDIWYVTFGAISYLLLFQYLRTPPVERRPGILVLLGLALGLNLASKLFIPAFTWMTVVFFLAVISVHAERLHRSRQPLARGLAPAALVTCAAAAMYLAVFLPHYWLGWWHSIWDIPKYFKDVVGYEAAVADATHPYSSKWYTWPFLLRPVWYHFKDVPNDPSHVVGVWGGGNPILWWGGFAAILVALARGIRERHFASVFLCTAFILHYIVWSWIGRTLFQYHYLPSLYASLLALGMALGMLWRAPADDGFWVGAGVALLVPLLPTLIGPFPRWGVLLWAAIAGVYGAAVVYRRLPTFQWPPGRVVVVAYGAVTIALLVYFYPLWSGMPIGRDGYSVRMWFQNGPARWI